MQICGERTPTQIMVFHMPSVKTMNLVQIKQILVLYQTLSHKLHVVQGMEGLANEIRIPGGVFGGVGRGGGGWRCGWPSQLVNIKKHLVY